MSGGLAGRVVAVTGGASGIGAATAERLRAGGAEVAVFDREPVDGCLSVTGDIAASADVDAAVATVEQNGSGASCGGPLDAGCDPVTSLIAAPGNRACVIAAIALVHMIEHGRIVEICGNHVRRLFFKPLDPQPPHGSLDDGEPALTVAFFGLARGEKGWWAVGTDGLYRFQGDRPAEFLPLPRFENKGGYRVSFAVPGLALVETGVNQRRSMSGSVPLVAAR